MKLLVDAADDRGVMVVTRVLDVVPQVHESDGVVPVAESHESVGWPDINEPVY